MLKVLRAASLKVLGTHARRHAAAVAGRLRASHEAEADRGVSVAEAVCFQDALSTWQVPSVTLPSLALQSCRRQPARPQQAAESCAPLRLGVKAGSEFSSAKC